MRILPDNENRKAFGNPQPGLFVFQDCLLCEASTPTLLCADCIDDLPQLPKQSCPVCALPTPTGEICGRCLREPPSFDSTRAAFRYDFPIDKLVQSFKYGHRLALGPYFGAQLAARTKDSCADMIVPLPLHPNRLATRGFNQAVELARPIASTLAKPLASNICRRIRDTTAQADLAWSARKNNIRNAFHCNEELSGKHILLVDDVMTTGASLNECARVLKLHGAATVDVVVLARALRD
ncbi:ComF family protein [Propionivibrio dicarboxylicus]|uniref:ComF family protein n=1 Tax=Propionivibrio dicarboxylicus TaxID=83767 RepID=A0A1G8IL28_9RHOO|nr:ComF family protein [Propionivibrio dicarboxylicus]SDI19542.1 comF family protein [Propionivibrio dicarboxylicus]